MFVQQVAVFTPCPSAVLLGVGLVEVRQDVLRSIHHRDGDVHLQAAEAHGNAAIRCQLKEKKNCTWSTTVCHL